MSRQDVFGSIKREMVGESADDHEGDQTGPCRRDIWGTRTWAGREPSPELCWGEIEFMEHVFADECFEPVAAGACLLTLGHVMLDVDMREIVHSDPLRRVSRC